MEKYVSLMGVLVLSVPLFVTALIEILKRIPVFPQVNKYTKIAVFITSILVIGVCQYQYAELTAVFAISVATQIVATYVGAIGFYETFKKILEKL